MVVSSMSWMQARGEKGELEAELPAGLELGKVAGGKETRRGEEATLLAPKVPGIGGMGG